MPKVQANGIDIYYEIKGAGEFLLLIAGFASDLTNWSKMVSLLAEKYRVIVFDNRGVGRSSAPESPYTIRQMADDTAGLLDKIGVDKAHVAGHSMGGMIAQEFALGYPEKVRSLMLLATCAKPDERNRAIIESWGELPRQVDAVTAARLSLPWIYTSNFYSRPKAVQQVIDVILNNPFPPPASRYLLPESSRHGLRYCGSTWPDSLPDAGAGGPGGHPAADAVVRGTGPGNSRCRTGRAGENGAQPGDRVSRRSGIGDGDVPGEAGEDVTLGAPISRCFSTSPFHDLYRRRGRDTK